MRTIQELLVEKGLSDVRSQENLNMNKILANVGKKCSVKENRQKSWVVIAIRLEELKVELFDEIDRRDFLWIDGLTI